ncbi:putative lipase [[Candida] railenensis]|uniref:Lipase n=1 Tax=[Candida] railenensis TaxID=45579 RepID=A0A9P0QP57_9ASCO|nr:putative lipase [[Candida] railenensis]
MTSSIWYRDKDSLQIGGVNRYTVRYTTDGPSEEKIPSAIFFRIKNTENAPIRAIHLLNGPFILYCHVVPCNYDHKQEFEVSSSKKQELGKDDSQADLQTLSSLQNMGKQSGSTTEVAFRNEIKPGQTFNVKLKLNRNSLKESSKGGSCIYEWSIDVISQIVITTYTYIHYDLMIGNDFNTMKTVNHGLKFTFSDIGSQNEKPKSIEDLLQKNKKKPSPEKLNKVASDTSLQEYNHPNLEVVKETANDMWSRPPKDISKPAHLVIVTHGIFANVHADMLYVKDSLENDSGQNIVVRGYTGNAGHTERGVKRLGKAVADYIVDLIESVQVKKELNYSFNKISFVGHSLGGCVQLYAIKYILVMKGVDYFQRKGLEPDQLICLASPLLGVLHEMSFVISWFLDIGALGKTGRDLTLSRKIPTFKDIKLNRQDHKQGSEEENEKHFRSSFRPLLETLPTDPLQKFLREFNHLTVYANAVNDGIVPLRTSSLLYLDWEALGKVGDIKEKVSHGKDKPEETTKQNSHSNEEGNATSSGSVKTVRTLNRTSIGEVPDDSRSFVNKEDEVKVAESQFMKYFEFLKINRTRKNLKSKREKFSLISAKGTDPELYKAQSAQGETKKPKVNEEDNGDDQLEDDEEATDEDADTDTYSESNFSELHIPPKASVIESALNTLICPVPTSTYITQPESRHDVIFHDKYYSFKNVPEEKSMSSTRNVIGQFLFKYHDNKVDKQVKIARRYHNNTTWRKVLVHLPPDAHNNIIVRRRFANGYGWGVIDHLVELFQDSKPKM